MENQVVLSKPFSPRMSWAFGSTFAILMSKAAAAKMLTKLALGWFAVVSFAVIVPFKELVRMSAQDLQMVKSLPMSQLRFAKTVRRTSPAVAIDPVYSHKLTLHSFEREYNLIFSGKITCGDLPCQAAAVKLHIESRQNPNIVKAATIQSDGSYEVSIFLKESLHEHMDWSLVADSPDSASRQVSGREILMDDSTVHIEQPVQLL
jgi:hypothetical protein